jgi:amino acid adenylation domain-containing protein
VQEPDFTGTLVDRFAEQVRATPSAPAVIDGGTRLDYAGLDALAGRIAGALAARGLRPGQSIAVCLPRSWQLVALMLGALRAGGVVVPIDAASPAPRVDFMLEDAACAALVHAGRHADRTLPSGGWIATVDDLLADRPAVPPAEPSRTGCEVAFLFYTSGTTGRPKGVEVAERGILRLVRSEGFIDIRPGDRFACLSNPAFDAISFEVWAPLLTGGCCIVIGDAELQDPPVLAARLEAERIDTLFMTVSLFNAIVDQHPRCFSTVRQVLIGGEQLNAEAVRAWYRANPDAGTRIVNVYGPTECTTFALSHPIPRDFAGSVVPIGRPLPGTGMCLVTQGREAEPGEVGELYLSGVGVALGYRNLPEETARRFVRLPWLDGGEALYYRTGDLVRIDGDGLVAYVGRIDRQVKVRGFRIEPGEVERWILRHPEVALAHVCTRRTEAGDHELLAYLVFRNVPDYAAFDAHLRAGLPPYMRPHRLFLVERLPLTPNGKLDESALIAQAGSPWRPPSTVEGEGGEWLRRVLDLAGELLDQPDLRPGDDFLGCGGDSLKALRLRFEMRRRWQCDLPVTAILGESFAVLAARLSRSAGDPSDARPPAPRASAARRMPASSEQQRLWFLQQRMPSSTAYNVPLIFRLDGPVDGAALCGALRLLADRHPGLRTAFEEGPDGPVQVVAETVPPVCHTCPPGRFDETSWRAFADLVFSTPFDLGAPTLFQAHWLPLSETGSVLLLHLHHVVVDGWSLNLLLRDLSDCYAALAQGRAVPPLPAVPTPLDFAQWQAQWFEGAAYRAQRSALRDLLRGRGDDQPLLPKVPEPGPQARLYRETLDAARRGALDRLCAELRLTRFEVLFSVFAWCVHAATGRSRALIASPVANRPLAEFEAAVGMFANTVLIPMTVDAPLGDGQGVDGGAVPASEEPGHSGTLPAHPEALGDDDLRLHLRRQVAAIRAVLAHQDVALADVVADLRPAAASGAPFDFMFVLENTDFSALALPGVAVTVDFADRVQAKCPLTLSVLDTDAGLECLWEYQCGYFDADDVGGLARSFRFALDLLLEGQGGGLGALVTAHREAFPQPGDGATVEPAFDTVADWFEYQARCTPSAPALVGRDRSFSYAQLDRMADALAGELLEAHALPLDGDRPVHVVLYLDASVEHVVALLALAKLNVTAVPLDPAYPLDLARQVLDQARPHCILLRAADGEALRRLDGGRFPRHVPTLAQAPRVALPATRRGVRPLYTLFTSGSTGTPKGVQVFDRTLCNLLQWQREDGGLAPKAVTLQFSMLSFDVSFQELFTTLCGGGCYHLIDPAWRRDADALLDYMATARIERIFMPYVALQLVAEAAVARDVCLADLREVVTAGEQLLCTDAIRRWFAGMPQAVLFNHYGPTETHVVSAFRLDGPAGAWPARAPIGRPVANARLRVVDGRDRPVPAGCAGHLLVAGPMVRRCYLADPVLNEARFVELADGTAAGGTRLYYRTGDLARFDHDGLLHYLGRDDEQVKVSGQRLELGQVEAALMRHPAVASAVVVAEGEPVALTAYLQAAAGAPPAAEALDEAVAGGLPAHVRIRRYRLLSSWPRTPSGKIDRRSLARADWVELARTPSRMRPAPAAGLEQALFRLFEDVTGRPIEPDQTFFEAGATSLGLMRFQLRCRSELGLPVTVADLFEHVTIRRLSSFLSGARRRRDDLAPAAGPDADGRIAVIGMALNVPGAENLDAFWAMVRAGGTGIEHFPAGTEGVVGARSQMRGLLDFDPDYFGIGRNEARLMDPQQRHLLMTCVHALEHAGIPVGRTSLRIGLVASCGENTYFQDILRRAGEGDLPDGFQMALHHDKDFLATKVAYHLDLTGPAMSVQAACGSSLIAVHVAGMLLRQGDGDVMLAAGVLADPTLTDGYRYRPQHIFSRDGHCRPFSDDAGGTIGASGCGVVVLKPLAQALADGDRVYAVIEGSAVNNDGRQKLSYTAPSVAGQGEAIRTALARAGLTGADIGYVEAHGTGTPLGDPVEVAALREAFGPAPRGGCALASVKSQIGHLGAAAGVVGLIRAVLAVFHGIVPPNVGFRAANPQLDLDGSPFYVPTAARPWPGGRRRVAGVSSFGIGGTNAHLVLGEAPVVRDGETVPLLPCLPVSAHSRDALLRTLAAIADYLEREPGRYPEVLRHLQAGRRQHRWRFGALCASVEEAVAALRAGGIRETSADVAADASPFDAGGQPAEAVLEAWLSGAAINWGMPPAQPPWDFPPSAFDLETCRFQPSGDRGVPADGSAFPPRRPAGQWLYQRPWVPHGRLDSGPVRQTGRILVVSAAGPVDDAVLTALAPAYRRVIELRAARDWRRGGPDLFEADLADPGALRRVLAALVEDGPAELDWLHALPLSVSGAVGAESLARAQWACLDTVAALMQAWEQVPDAAALRLWLLSHGACPVEGGIERPELSALAGPVEVVPQEYPVRCHWLDLPSPSWGRHAAALAALLSDPSAPRRLAVRGDWSWRPVLVPLVEPTVPEHLSLLPDDGVFLVIGGGGIGGTLCRWLLQAPARRVVLLSRRAGLPPGLEAWRDRIDLVRADVGDLAAWPAVLDAVARLHSRLDGVIHAAGIGAGSMIGVREAGPMAEAMRARTAGMLAVEALIARFRPGFVLYCSSMSTVFGGAGQFDYAASNALLDGFAQYRPAGGPDCVRMAVDWDVWRDAGMAAAAPADARHRAHLAVGLSAEEGARVFAQALHLRMPRLLVSTTEIEASRRFYPTRHARPEVTVGRAAEPVPLASHLRDCLCRWLGVEELDPDESLRDLGADSLTLLDLVGELETGFGIEVRLSQLSHQVSLNEVLGLAGASPLPSRSAPDWSECVRVDPWNEGEGHDVLCLVHPVGGDVEAYRELVSVLDPDQPVCVIADPALAHPDLPPVGVEERAAHYLRALERRYPRREFRWRLAGWSFGAWVAHAMCALAERAGAPAPELYAIDPPAPDAGPELAGYSPAEIEASFLDEMSRHWPASDGPPPEMQDYVRRLLRCCKANVASMTTHRPVRLERTVAHVFVAMRSSPAGLAVQRPAEVLRREWQALLPRMLTWRTLDADHYGIVTGAAARTVARTMSGNRWAVSA